MRKVIATLAILMQVSFPADALECDPDRPFHSDYWWHQEQPESYVLVLGRFSGLELIESTVTRDRPGDLKQGHTVFRAAFVGFKASRRAFDQPFSTDVTLVFPDWSIIGGGIDTASMADGLPEKVGLVWLMRTQNGYEVFVGPCDILVDTDPAKVKPALRCLRGGYCPKPG